MRKTRVWITMGCCLLAAASCWGQGNRKPGLWETTANMTWQQSPFPPNMPMPPAAAAAFGGGPHTVQVCLTQAWIDRFGGPIPQSRGDCQFSAPSIKLTGMSTTFVCSGQMNGSGSVDVDWSMPDTAKGKVHFTGTMSMGPNPRPIEWTNEFSSVYKGPDCGSVKPLQLPPEK